MMLGLLMFLIFFFVIIVCTLVEKRRSMYKTIKTFARNLPKKSRDVKKIRAERPLPGITEIEPAISKRNRMPKHYKMPLRAYGVIVSTTMREEIKDATLENLLIILLFPFSCWIIALFVELVEAPSTNGREAPDPDPTDQGDT